ncbi:hypothetical protein [Azoarcus sp. KH32C]|uniref:hypothetical protein n=1 Tax=Azoarcus sp. KH32C TaxID=748247 RepID=UPI00023863C7|nr:hypothetical protein [Azoarcus sp. KH32C]BAL24128.1 hypothetical protein AZKH_1815 [Azoarcus sp. KH32C]
MDAKPSVQSANLIAEASQEWLNACMRPWSILNTLNAFWSDQWKLWLSAVASTPAPWLPALAEEREGQPAVIDFFLPWLPRLDMSGTPRGAVDEKDFVRAMLRAAAPHIGAATIDAPSGKTNAVSRASGVPEDESAARTKPTVRKIPAQSASAQPPAGDVAEAAPQAKVAAAAKAKTVKSGKAPARKTPSAAKKASAPAAAKDKAAE